MLTVTDLPHLNAVLNASSAVLLVLGFRAIRRLQIDRHRRLMLSALGVSALFLVSYLTYHAQVGSVKFTATGVIRPIYYAILLTHVVLAATVVPLAIATATLALRGRIDRHRRLARWTWPIWMYVSVSGVVVYVLLYHLYPPGS